MKNWRRLAVTAEQMARVDAYAVTSLGVQLIQMMENAGRQLARLALEMLGGQASNQPITVLCGSGNNGGGGMVAARHLHNWGADVTAILAAEPERLKETPALQWRAISALGLASKAEGISPSALIIDALLGYSGRGNPRIPISTWINHVNKSGIPILSLDLPSGLDATTGLPGLPCVKATTTLTLARPKTGLFSTSAKEFVGDLFLADIGIPPEAFQIVDPEFAFEFQSDSPLRIS